MPNLRTELYCSEACESTMIVRSFGKCPECNQVWNMQGTGDQRHYRNNAWMLCDTCSRAQGRCVVCGSDVRPAP